MNSKRITRTQTNKQCMFLRKIVLFLTIICINGGQSMISCIVQVSLITIRLGLKYKDNNCKK